jgi:hypothetical protein
MRHPRSRLLAGAAVVVVALTVIACNPATGTPSPTLELPTTVPSLAPSVEPSLGTEASPDTSLPATGSGQITVTATEYAFTGVPATIETGATLTLQNSGQEPHQLVVLRKEKDLALSPDELLRLPPDQLAGMVTLVGSVSAEPGATSSGSVTLDQPGTYILFDPTPTGATALPSFDLGAPMPSSVPIGGFDFLKGMLVQVTVTGGTGGGAAPSSAIVESSPGPS